MKTNSVIQRRFTLALVLFTALISAIWFGYHNITYTSARESAKEKAQLAAGRLFDRISSEFSQMKSVAGVIAGSSYIQDFLSADGLEDFFAKAENASEIIRSVAFSSQPAGSFTASASNIISFNAEGRFYRFIGGLSNDACAVLRDAVSITGTLHTIIELDGVLFFCYSTPVYSFSGQTLKRIGTVVLLTHIDRKRTSLAGSTLIDTVVIQDNFVMYANDETLEGREIHEIESMYEFVSLMEIEGTGLIAAAAVKNEAMFPEREFFIAATIAMFAILLITVLILHRYSSGYIILPMELKAKNAEIEKHKALIFSLKKQINAHFTNNTLNTIRILIKQNELQNAETVAAGLSSLVRYAHDKEELINIWDELSILQNYIFIMNTRLDGKLKAEFDFDDRLMDCEIPRMLLQPIIENAIVHGFAEMDSRCAITVKASRCGDSVLFQISDNGRGMDDEQLSALIGRLNINPDAGRGYENIAFLNIKNRLWYYYGDAGKLGIAGNSGGGIVVSVTIPLNL